MNVLGLLLKSGSSVYRNRTCCINIKYIYIQQQENLSFQSLIMQKSFESQFYWAKNDLSDILYECLCNDKDKREIWIWKPFMSSI